MRNCRTAECALQLLQSLLVITKKAAVEVHVKRRRSVSHDEGHNDDDDESLRLKYCVEDAASGEEEIEGVSAARCTPWGVDDDAASM
jgi:hypothetical protein